MRKSDAVIYQVKRMSEAGHSIRKITESLGVSRNTVRRYLRASTDKDVPPTEIESIEGPAWLKSIDKDQMIKELASGTSLKQLYLEYDLPVVYAQFTRQIKRLYPKKKIDVALHLKHNPGERAQIDYCDGLYITDRRSGKMTKTQFFCGVLPFSSYTFGEFSLDQKLKSFIFSHERMWQYFGGVTPYVVVDNLKSGVTKAHRYDPDINPTYCDFGNHYGFAVLAAKPYSPRFKACVEATIGVIQRDFFQRFRHEIFYSLDELNLCFRKYLNELNSKIMNDYGLSRAQRCTKEKEKLGPLPSSPYEFIEWKQSTVHPDSCIQIDRALYSVPYGHCAKKLKVKMSDQIVIIFDEKLEPLATHVRQSQFGKSLKDEHFPDFLTQNTSFSIQKAKAQADAVGQHCSQYISWQFDIARPLSALRRVQGVLRLMTDNISKESMEYAAAQAFQFRRRDLNYFKQWATFFESKGPILKTVANCGAPTRDSSTIHLQP